jgi:hypothetical protein
MVLGTGGNDGFDVPFIRVEQKADERTFIVDFTIGRYQNSGLSAPARRGVWVKPDTIAAIRTIKNGFIHQPGKG